MTGSRGSAPAARLFVEAPLTAGATILLSQPQSHYLLNVLRLRPGEDVAVFNGDHGEWRAVIEAAAKRAVHLHVLTPLRAQDETAELWLLAAPIKGDRIDYVIEKATELGVSRIMPVVTRRTVVSRINQERLQARAREAAQQCERMTVPIVAELDDLATLLGRFPPDGILLVGDETGEAPAIADILDGMARPAGPLAVLIGPEGGFAREELDVILKLPFAKSISLGPRVLRADTAALAAVAVIQAILGDGRRSRSRL